GINPYALGLDMMQDIQRISTKPTAEDRDWFPDMADQGNWREVLLDAWAEHRDESFIRQYLSPALIRKWRFFVLGDAADQPHCLVASIHDERGYAKIRAALANSYDLGANRPDIQVVDVDLLGDRHLRLQHKVNDGILLEDASRDATLRHIRRLWGYEVSLAAMDAETGATIHERSTSQIAG
ncbi:SpoVR family protein, partial [Mesorhizobium sp. M7A.F.Ca.US.001.01.1.1]